MSKLLRNCLTLWNRELLILHETFTVIPMFKERFRLPLFMAILGLRSKHLCCNMRDIKCSVINCLWHEGEIMFWFWNMASICYVPKGLMTSKTKPGTIWAFKQQWFLVYHSLQKYIFKVKVRKKPAQFYVAVTSMFIILLPHRQIKYPVDFDDELKTRKRHIR